MLLDPAEHAIPKSHGIILNIVNLDSLHHRLSTTNRYHEILSSYQVRQRSLSCPGAFRCLPTGLTVLFPNCALLPLAWFRLSHSHFLPYMWFILFHNPVCSVHFTYCPCRISTLPGCYFWDPTSLSSLFHIWLVSFMFPCTRNHSLWFPTCSDCYSPRYAPNSVSCTFYIVCTSC